MWIKICLKFLIFLKKFVKIRQIRQALEVPPPDPSLPPAAGGSALVLTWALSIFLTCSHLSFIDLSSMFAQFALYKIFENSCAICALSILFFLAQFALFRFYFFLRNLRFKFFYLRAHLCIQKVNFNWFAARRFE